VTAESDGGGRPGESRPASARQAPEPRRGEPQRPAYEQARDELTELVKRLETGGLTLEQSLQLWERGEQLAAICEEWLEGARARLGTAMAQQHHQYQEPSHGAPF
jgi:exodeoxyribonuclease VII small subunit